MEAKPAANNHHRYRQLDSLRGLAAFAVFLTHFLGLNALLPLFSYTGIPSLCSIVATASVIFFFVLSGFVLSLPFLSNEKPLKLTSFYIKRIFRIYPVLIVAIVLSVLLKEFIFHKAAMAPFPGWVNNFWNWNWNWNRETAKEMLKTFLLIGPDFKVNLIDPPVWSLIIEMKMSIILPFFIIVISRNSVYLNIGLLLVITYLTCKYSSWALPVFYLGILTAKYRVYLTNIKRLQAAIFVIAAILVSVLLCNNRLLDLFAPTSSLHKYNCSQYIMAVDSCIVITIVLARKKISQFFSHRIFTFFGDISYSFYLIHAPLLLTMASIFTNRFALSPIYVFLSALIPAIVVSYLLLVFIEKPFQRFAKILTGKFKVFDSLTI